MTLYHFGNCLALVSVPYYMAYKYSGLSEYGAFWKCVQAGGIYIFTQLCKMLLLATFFPDTETGNSAQVDYLGEFLKGTVDIADLLGLYLVLAGIPGKGHSKILTAGIGWACAEVLSTRTLLLWFGARGSEFDWKYIQKCLESNISLVQHVSTTALVWLWGRHDLNKKFLPLVVLLLILTPYKPLIMDIVTNLFTTGPWMALMIKAGTTLLTAFASLHVYAGVAQNSLF